MIKEVKGGIMTMSHQMYNINRYKNNFLEKQVEILELKNTIGTSLGHSG